MRQFAVIGLGRFGSAVARRLVKNGCQVLAMDKDEDKAQAMRDVVDAVVIGDATERKVLEQLRLTEVDEVIVCMGDQMAASILVALHLIEMGVKHIRSKAVGVDHENVLLRLGVEQTFVPERDMAERMADRLSFPNMLEFIPVLPEYAIMELACPSEMSGKSLRELDLRALHGVQVLAVREYVPERITMSPGGDFVVKDSDVLIVLGRNEDIEEVRTRK